MRKNNILTLLKYIYKLFTAKLFYLEGDKLKMKKRFYLGIFIMSTAMILFASIFFRVVNIVISYDIQESIRQSATNQENNSEEEQIENDKVNTNANDVENNTIAEDAQEDAAQIASVAEPMPIAVTSSTTYRDWSTLSSLNEKYSYSTLVWQSNSKVTVLSDTKTDAKHYMAKDPSGEDKPKFRAYQGDIIKFVVTNCGVDADGNAFDVVFTVDNVTSYRKGSYITPDSDDDIAHDDDDRDNSDFIQLKFRGMQYINNQNAPTADTSGSGYDDKEDDFTKEGHLVTFHLQAYHASCTFKMEYYRTGTYNSTKQKANVTGVNSFFFDFDVPHTAIPSSADDAAGVFFGGDEGMAPQVGSSTIWYDRNEKNTNPTYKVVLDEKENGIACTACETNTNGIWYKTSACMTTDLQTKGDFSFKYGGDSCGLWYNFVSPVAFNEESIKKYIEENSTLKQSNDVREQASFNYVIQQYIPSNYYGQFLHFDTKYSNIKDPRYNTFSITDTIPSDLTITNTNNIKITTEDGVDKSSYFTVSVSGNKVTVTAKPDTLQNDAFYYSHTYNIRIPVQVKSGVGKGATFNSGNKYIDNIAMYSYTRDGRTESRNSNKVQTTLNYKVTTSITHGTITETDNDVKIHENKTVTFNPSPGYYVSNVTVDGSSVYQSSYADGGSVTLSDVREDRTVTVVCSPISGTITINKTDSSSGAKLTGVTFKVFEWDNSTSNYKTTGTTLSGNNGTYTATITYSETNKGKFKIEETAAPAHYYAPDWSQTINLITDNKKNNFTYSYNVTNVHYPQGKITVNKKDSITNANLSGAIFKLYEYTGTGDTYKEVETLSYTSNGNYTSSTFEYTPTNQGKFKVVETRAPEHYYGYSDSDAASYRKEHSITLSKDANQTLHNLTWNTTNVHYPQGKVTVNKTDSITSAKLPGATFKLYEYKGTGDASSLSSYNEVETLSGNGSGSYTSKVFEYTPTNQGKFKVVETQAPEHYFGHSSSDDEKYRQVKDITLTTSSTEILHNITWNATNVHYPQGKVTISKTDSITKAKLSGATFKLYEYKGSGSTSDLNSYKEVETLKDNGSGSYTSNVFEYTPTNQGRFKVVETKAPAHYYGNSDKDDASYRKVKDITLTISSSEILHSITWDVTNLHYPQGRVTVNKTDNVTHAKLPGAIFALYEYKGSGSTSDISNYTRKSQLTDNKNGSYTSAIFEYSPINQGRFKIVEERAPEHYYGYSDEDDPKYRKTYDVTLEKDETKILHELTWTMDNTPYPKAQIILRKTDSITSEVLDEAKFRIYEWNKNSNNWVARGLLTDNGDGTYKTPGEHEAGVLEYSATNQGRFKIDEEAAPYYYTNPGTSIAITLTDPGFHTYTYSDHANYNVKDEPWKVKIKAIKVDSETKNRIEGADYTVYEYNKNTKQYEEYKINRQGSTIKLEFQEDRSYISGDWLYANRRNEGKFRIIETRAPEGYYGDYVSGTKTKVVNDITITAGNNGSTLTIDNHSGLYYNTRVLGTITVSKIDVETNRYLAQGDATLDGAVYGLYAAEEIKHKDTVKGTIYVKDQKVQEQTIQGGKLVFDDVEIGKYYVKEITPPVGYLPDENKYNVSIDYQNETIPHIDTSTTVHEQVKKQAFQLVKLSENNETTEAFPLEGAGFKIYLVSDLSFVKNGTVKPDANGKYNPKDFIGYNYQNEQTALDYSNNQNGTRIKEQFTDELGKFTSPELAYGTYVVVETTIPDERYIIDPFIVVVTKDSKTPQNERYFLDREFEATIRVNKRDTENGEMVLNKDAAYRIWSFTENRYIEQPIRYPKADVVGTEKNPYRINEEGYFITPVNLTVGEYELREVTAPDGYVLTGHEGSILNGQVTNEPRQAVRFSVSSHQAYYQDTITDALTISVEQYNTQMKGELKLIKKGEYLTGASQNEDGSIDFKYELGAIENAKFEIRAKENIYAQYDSSVIVYEKDALVGTITTNIQGIGYVDNLPIGKYYIKETEAGYGFVLNKEQKEFEISYQGQTTPTQTVEIEYINERQKINLNGEEGIKVEKIADKKWYKPGETATYTIKVSNPTNNDITDITVSETRINGEFEYIDTDNVKKIDSTHVSIERLKPGESVNLRFSAQIGELEEGEEKVKITNVVKAEGTTEIPDPDDPHKKITVTVDDEDDEDVYVTEGKILVIKEAQKKVYEPGETAQYIIHVINTGDATLHNVETEETLINGRFVDLEGSSVNGVKIAYKTTEAGEDRNVVIIDKIEPGEEIILRYEYDIPQGVTLPVEGTEKHLIDNVVMATGTIIRDNPENPDKPVDPEDPDNPDNPEEPIEEKVTDKDDEEIEVKENGKLGIIKKDILTGERLKGAVFGLYAFEDIRAQNGNVLIKKDALIEKSITNEQGQAIFKADLPLGKYYIQEIEPPENYKPNSEKVVFNSTYRGQDVEIIDVSEVITNRRIDTIIEKRNKEGELVEGVELEILDENGNVIETWTTTDQVTMFEKLEKGKTYTLREKKPAKGYVTARKIKFFVGDDGKLYQRIEDDEEFLIENIEIERVEMLDERTRIELNVVDKETKEHIPGIEVEIRDKETGEVVYSFTTGEDIEIIEGLDVGEYDIVTKDPENRGYVTSGGEIKVKDVNVVQKFVVEQDFTKVEISLKDEETKEFLKGGIIEVVDENGEVVAEIETKEQAERLERLPVGKYTLKEKQIPTGYHGAKDMQIEIKDTPEVQPFEMLNKKKRFDISIKKKVVAQEYNGTRTELNYDLPKLEIRTRNIPSADAWFMYIVTVKNEGELAGSVEVIEYIPSGMQMKPERNPQWEVHANDATLKIDNLEPGETREYTIWLRYDNYLTNLGTKENKVRIAGTNNEAGFKDINTGNDESTASIIIAISTGLGRTGDIIMIILLTIVIGGISAAIVVQGIKRKKGKESTDSKE